jgi:hypothetical protein
MSHAEARKLTPDRGLFLHHEPKCSCQWPFWLVRVVLFPKPLTRSAYERFWLVCRFLRFHFCNKRISAKFVQVVWFLDPLILSCFYQAKCGSEALQ